MTDDRAAWAAGMKGVHQEAAGVLEFAVVMLPDLPGLMVEAYRANSEACRILDAVSHALHRIRSAPWHLPALCGCCSKPLPQDDFAFVVAWPANQPASTHMLAMAICDLCGTDRDAIRAAGVRAMQELWPGSRPIALTHTPGGNA